MLIQIVVYAAIAGFVGLAVLGHILVIQAMFAGKDGNKGQVEKSLRGNRSTVAV